MSTVLYSDIQNQAAEVAGRTRDKLPVKEQLMIQGFCATALREVWNGQYQWPELIPAVLELGLANPSAGSVVVPSANGFANPFQDYTAVTVASGTYPAAAGVYTWSPSPGRYVGPNGYYIAYGPWQGFNQPQGNYWVLSSGAGGLVASPTLVGPYPPPLAIPAAQVTLTNGLVTFGDYLGCYTENPQGTTRFAPLRFEDLGSQVILPDGARTVVWLEYMLPCPDLNILAGAPLLAYPIPSRFRNYLAWTAAGHLCRADGQVAQGDEFLALAQSEILVELRRLIPVPRRLVRQRDLIVDQVGAGQAPKQG